MQAGGALRLGIGGDLTEAPALIGLQMGFFGQNLGKVTLEPQVYPSQAGGVAALRQGLLDAAYLDPVTALQAWQASPKLLEIVAGTASGGAELVVSPKVKTPAQLEGKRLAPSAGSTQQAAATTGYISSTCPRSPPTRQPRPPRPAPAFSASSSQARSPAAGNCHRSTLK